MELFSANFTQEENDRLIAYAEKIKKTSSAVIHKWALIAAGYYKGDSSKVMSRYGKQEDRKARYIIMYHFKRVEGLSYEEVGEIFKMSHASVMADVKIAESNLMKDYAKIKEKVDLLTDEYIGDGKDLIRKIDNPPQTIKFKHLTIIHYPIAV